MDFNKKPNEDDAPQKAPEAKELQNTEDELLQSSDSAEEMVVEDLSSAPLTEAVEKLHIREKRTPLSGAARKRLRWLMRNGLNYTEAREKCLKPIEASEKARTKRPRSEESTPASGKAEKRAKKSEEEREVAPPQPSTSRAQGLNFKDALNKVKVGIMHTNFPEESLSKDQMMAVQEAILVKVSQTEGLGLLFSGVSLRPGWLCITCDNKDTAEWLMCTVKGMEPWDDASLKAVEEKDLPKSRILSAYFPNSSEDSTEFIVKMLRAQNQSLNVAEWRVVHRSNEGTAAHLLLAVDIASIGMLQKTDFKLGFKFGKVALRSRSTTNKPPQKSTSKSKEANTKATCSAPRDQPSTSGKGSQGKSKGKPSPDLDPPQKGYRPGKGKEYKPQKPKKQ